MVVVLVVLGVGIAVVAGSVDARPLLAQCEDNVDNDGDTKVDTPFDPGCTGNNDNTEGNPAPLPACSDLADNDLPAPDGKIDFPADPQCSTAADTDESGTAVTQCSDGADQAPAVGADYPADPNCLWAADPNEGSRQCSNGVDDDGDGSKDFPADIGCSDLNDNTETNLAQCDDGRDNDGDGTHDFLPQATRDAGCSSAADTVEGAPDILPACADRVDNDGDGKIDFPADPGCSASGDADETDPPGESSDPPPPPPAKCADGLDNDGDGRIDLDDPGCASADDDDETHAITFVTQGPPSPAPSPRLLSPFPIVRLRGSADRRGVRITLLTVRAPQGSTVSIYCAGRTCPRKSQRMTARTKLVRARRFEKRMRGGTILRIYVTKPGFIGKFTRFRFRTNRVPLRADRCATTPGKRPRACP